MSKQHYGSSRRSEYFRRKIPVALVSVLGRDEVTKSLRRCPGENVDAKRRALASATDDLFARAMQEAVPGELSPQFAGELDCLLRHGRAPNYIRETLAAHHVPPLVARYRAVVLATEGEELAEMDVAAVAARNVDLGDVEAQLRRATTIGDVAVVDATARTLLAAEGLNAVRAAPEYQALLAQLLAADLRVVIEQRARLSGEPGVAPAIPLPVRDAPRLADLIDDWVDGNAPHVNTVKAVRSIIREFEKRFGTLPVIAINRIEAVNFGKYLLAATPKQAKKTVQKKIHLLGALFGPAIEAGKYGLTANPFSRLPVAKKNSKKSGGLRSRRAFGTDELQALFDSPVYRQGKRLIGGDGEAMFWLPLIATFTGAREEEIAQLRIVDIERYNGAYVFRFVDEGQLQLKNPSSYRWVPVHRELIRCGLLQYVREVKAAGHERLFPEMERGANGKFSDNFSKCFNRYLNNVVRLPDPSLVFHSTRNTFKQRTLVCGIEMDVRDALTGHSVAGKSAARGYEVNQDNLYPLPKLVEAMRMFRYDELNLSHLYVCDDGGRPLPPGQAHGEANREHGTLMQADSVAGSASVEWAS